MEWEKLLSQRLSTAPGERYIDDAYAALIALASDAVGAQDGKVTQNVLPTPVTSELLISDSDAQNALVLIRQHLSLPSVSVAAAPNRANQSYTKLCQLLVQAINTESNE